MEEASAAAPEPGVRFVDSFVLTSFRASSRVVVFASRRGAERRRAQRLIGLIDEFLPAEVDRQSKREIHGDKMRLEMSPALSFPVVVSIFLSALSASPHLCVRSPPRATAIKYFGTFHTMGEKLVFDDIDASIARQKT